MKYFNMKTHFIGTLLLASSLLLLSSCAVFHSGSAPDMKNMSIPLLRHRVEQNYLKFNSARAKAKLSLESPELSFTANCEIRIKMPDSLLVQLNSGLGFGVGAIFIDKNQVQIYNSMENALFLAHPDSFNFRRFLMVDVPIEKLFEAFSGIHLIEQHDREILQIDNNHYLIIGSKDGLTLKYWIDPKKYVVRKFQLLDSSSNILVEFKYDQFIKSRNVFLPKTVRISQPDQKSRLTIVFTKIEVNTEFQPRDFEMRLPENVDRILL